MRHLLLVMTLIVLPKLSAADPASPAPPTHLTTPTGCAPSGVPIFEQRESSTHRQNATYRLYADGAYTADITDKDGKVLQHVINVCVSREQLEQAKAALAAAEWKVTKAMFTCKVAPTESTAYLVNGKEVFREQVCSGARLDETSAASLATLEGVLRGPAPD